MNEHKEPNIGISALQLITFIASFIIVYFILGIILTAIANIVSKIPFISGIFIIFPVGDTILYSLLPIFTAIIVYTVNNILYKKYYFGLVSTVGFFMLLSWLLISHLIGTAQNSGLISWTFLNWLWSDVLLAISFGISFVPRMKIGEKKNGNSEETSIR